MGARSRAGVTTPLVYVAAQALSLLANYGFQVIAARSLPAGDYVALFAWLSKIAAWGILSAVTLNLAILRPSPRARRSVLRLATAGLAAVAVILAWLRPETSFVTTIALAVAFGYWAGEALARERILRCALASTAVFVTRVGWFASSPRLDVGYRATILGFVIGLLVLVVPLDDGAEDPGAGAPGKRAPTKELIADVVRASVLSGIQAVAPVADYLLLAPSMHGDQVIAWASSSLLVRVPIVLGLGALQVTLAKRIAGARTGARLPAWVIPIEVGMPLALGVAALLPIERVLVPLGAYALGTPRDALAAMPFGAMTWSAGAILAVVAACQVAHTKRRILRATLAVNVAGGVSLIVSMAGGPTLSRLASLGPAKMVVLASVWTLLAAVLCWLSSHGRASRVGPGANAERSEDP